MKSSTLPRRSTLAPKPRRRPLRLKPTERQRIEDAIERLVEILDAFDAPDDEKEPSLGSIGSTSTAEWVPQTRWSQADDGADLEDEHDGAEPNEDGEPSLGSLDAMPDQRQSYRQGLANGFNLDAELDPTE
jgi:hypothetical protein